MEGNRRLASGRGVESLIHRERLSLQAIQEGKGGRNWKGETNGRRRSRWELARGKEIKRREDTDYPHTAGSRGIVRICSRKRVAPAKNRERDKWSWEISARSRWNSGERIKDRKVSASRQSPDGRRKSPRRQSPEVTTEAVAGSLE